MKKLLSVILALSISFSAVSFAAESPSEWAKGEVADAEGVGIAKGSYNYRAPISRGDFCGLIYNYLDILNIEFDYDGNKFTDTTDKKIIALSNMGIVNGRAEDKFAPNATLTREEAATILARVVNEVRPLEATGMTGDWIVFYDEAEFSPWAKFNVQNMYKYGIMGGVGKKEIVIGVTGGSESITTRPVFDPKGTFTAEQAIATIYRLYNMTIDDIKASDGTFADRMNALMPNDTNYMFSPFSVKMALLMAANGADGETKLEILNTVGVENLESYNDDTKELIERYSQSDLLTLRVSNSIWINKDKTEQRFSKEYESAIKKYFGGEAGVITNANGVERVNDWVNEKTGGKIPSIISSSDFRALLVNAVYFKGRWADEFNLGATKKDIFITRDKKQKTIYFMNKTDWMGIAQVDGVTIVEIPYLTRENKFDDKGEYLGTTVLEDMDVSMYLMMSDSDFSPEKVLKSARMSSGYLALSVPKFEIKYDGKIGNILHTLGIKRAFKEDAEFSKMFDVGNMWIDSVIHKTYISVDEEGTEAAAVTAIAMAGSALPPEPREIKFNRPFTFVIKDNISGEILFMGEYAY